MRPAAGEDGHNSVGAVGSTYFRRKLRILDEASELEILDSELLSLERSVVILGEPGMGKSELIGELGRAGGVVPAWEAKPLGEVCTIKPPKAEAKETAEAVQARAGACAA